MKKALTRVSQNCQNRSHHQESFHHLLGQLVQALDLVDQAQVVRGAHPHVPVYLDQAARGNVEELAPGVQTLAVALESQ